MVVVVVVLYWGRVSQNSRSGRRGGDAGAERYTDLAFLFSVDGGNGGGGGGGSCVDDSLENWVRLSGRKEAKICTDLAFFSRVGGTGSGDVCSVGGGGR